MLSPPDLDPKSVKRQFTRRAARLADADFLLREIERRMLERLEPVRLAPQSIVDIGCGLGQGLLALKKRYPAASLLGIDLSPAVARRAAATLAPPARGFFARLRRESAEPVARVIAADTHALPLPDSRVDLLWSNLALHWFVDPLAVITEWQRVLRPGGLLAFSFFGVDTFVELRRAGARLMHFHDMHDIGDALLGAGLAEPVMDTERLVLEWREPAALLRDLHALGGNALRGRFRGLLGRRQGSEWRAALERMRSADGRLRLTAEVVFGHAWCPARKRLPQGLSPIEFVPRRRSNGPYP